MGASKKRIVQTERPRIRRVYVSVVNPDDSKDSAHFTVYDERVEEVVSRIVNKTAPRPESAQPTSAVA